MLQRANGRDLRPSPDAYGSSIVPADTFSRPAIRDAGSGLDELAKSLSGLGGQFTQLAAEQGQAKEQQDLERIDQHVANVRSQFGSQAITDTQLGIALPDSNYLVKTRVGEQLGSIAAQEALAAEQEKLLADPDLRLDPQRMDQRIKELEAQANAYVKDNPAWGAGYARTFRNGLNAIRQQTQGERGQFYEKVQTEQLEQDYENGIKGSGSYVPPYVQNSPSAQRVLAADPSTLARPIQVARALIGADENRNTKAIAAFIKQGSGATVDPSVTPWCAAFVDAVLGQSGSQTAGTLRAADFKTYGEDASADPRQGDIIVMKPRTSGGISGHVGFIVGKNADGSYDVLSGNQGNKVTVSRYSAEQVVAIRRPVEGSFKAQAKAATVGGTASDYTSALAYAESGNDPTAKNPRSSAAGIAQFTDGTWIGMMKKYRPADVAGMSDQRILSMRNSPVFSKEMSQRYAEENAATLQRNGVPVNNTNLYLSHVFDGKNAAKIIKANPGTPIEELVSAKVLEANPYLKGKKAGEVVEWGAKKIGAPVDPNLARQNATRQTDRNYAASSSLGAVRRREIVTGYAIKRAIATGDRAYLDGIPPEMITPDVDSKITEARQKISDLEYQQYNRKRQIEADQRQDAARAAIDEINKKVAAGEEIDPRNYADNSEAYNYAYGIQQQERNITQQDSAVNADRLQSQIEEGAITNDYSGVLGEGKSKATIEELQDHIRQRKDIRTADKLKLIEGLGVTMEAGTVANSPAVSQFYNRRIDGYVKGLAQSIMLKAGSQLTGFNIEGYAKEFYEGEVHARVKEHVQTHGSVPRGEDMRNILEKVEADLEKKLAQVAATGQRPADEAPPAAAAPAAPQASPPSRVQTETKPDGTIILKPQAAAPAPAPQGSIKTPGNVHFSDDNPAAPKPRQKSWTEGLADYLGLGSSAADEPTRTPDAMGN